MEKPPEAVMERALRNMSDLYLQTNSREKFTDEDLEYWGNFYTENNLRSRNILFAAFIKAPREIAAAVIFRKPRRLAMTWGGRCPNSGLPSPRCCRLAASARSRPLGVKNMNKTEHLVEGIIFGALIGACIGLLVLGIIFAIISACG